MSIDVSTLEGNYKKKYSDGVAHLIPDHVKLYNAIKYSEADRVGDSYNEPVVLSLESGFTYGGSDGNLFDLEDANEFKMRNATIKANELVLRSAISMAALRRSSNKDQAVAKAQDLMVANMLKSMYHRLEVQMFYGQSNIGVVKTDITGGAPSEAVEIKDAEWASGIWNGTTNAYVDVLSSDETTLVGTYQITGYSIEDKTVTLKAAAGNLGAAEIGQDDVIYFKGAAEAGGPATKNEFLGIHGISAERTSLFGITNTNEPLFQGSIQDVGTDATTNAALLSQAKVEAGIAKMVEKGLMTENVTLYVNPRHWDDLLSEQDAKRVHDSSYSPNKHQSGARELEFFGQNGTIKVVASTFVKEGYAYIICEKDFKRIGSTEVTFNRPDGKEIYRVLEGKNGIEMRCSTDQALFTSRPASVCQLRYIKTEA